MNEPLVIWLFVVFVAFWRMLMDVKRLRSPLQRCLGRRAFVQEWYFWAVVLLSLMLARTAFDVVWFDYIKTEMLTARNLQEKVPAAERSGDLALPRWLRTLVLLAPFVGAACFMCNVYVVVCFVRRQKAAAVEDARRKREDTGDYPLEHGSDVVVRDGGRRATITVMYRQGDADQTWVKIKYRDTDSSDWVFRGDIKPYVKEPDAWRLNPSADMTLLVILMPAVFVVMAMRAEIRELQIFLGSSYRPGEEHWEDYALWRKCTYSMDLECAAAFQYLTVLAFAQLCTMFFTIDDLAQVVEIREKELIVKANRLANRSNQAGEAVESSLQEHLAKANREHRSALTYAGLQGLGSYIVVGFFRCVFGIVMAGLDELKADDDYKQLMLQVLESCQPVFVFTAALCIYNWTVIQRLSDMKDKRALGKNATWKFMAARALLLIGDGQKSLLRSAWVGKRMLELSEPQADLLHAALLLFECSLVVAWNACFWRKPVKAPRALLRALANQHNLGYDRPLLHAA